MIVTAGAIDCHVHFICPQLIYEAISSGELPNWNFFWLKVLLKLTRHYCLNCNMSLYLYKFLTC